MRPKSLHFATFAFPLRDAPFLPLTGELHPLRREALRWILWGNGVSLSLAVLAVALGGTWWREKSQEPLPPPGIVVQIDDLTLPPTITIPEGPRIHAPVDALARFGIPEPVPAAPDVPTDFATQEDLRNLPSVLDQGGLGKGTTIVLDAAQSNPDPSAMAVQDYPRLLRIEPPVYPSIALEAGIEGTVLVRVLVGKDGRVKQWVFIAGNSILKEAALASARTAVFSPAMQHHEPVEVWVQIPVQFSLK